jgi:hypothetical protein
LPSLQTAPLIGFHQVQRDPQSLDANQSISIVIVFRIIIAPDTSGGGKMHPNREAMPNLAAHPTLQSQGLFLVH